jgi:hypothetical protein
MMQQQLNQQQAIKQRFRNTATESFDPTCASINANTQSIQGTLPVSYL